MCDGILLLEIIWCLGPIKHQSLLIQNLNVNNELQFIDTIAIASLS